MNGGEVSLDASIIVCTRNRAEPLARLLESISALDIPTGTRWEVIVVNNGSSDGTDAVLAAFQDRLPIRPIQESKAGVSNARNRGVEASKGRYICWTDDDVILDRGWLAAYLEAFERHPEASLFGGKIEPELEVPRHAMFDRWKLHWPLAPSYAHCDFGDAIVPLHGSGPLPWGANFALRAEAQRSHSYDVQLGPSPVHRRLADESELIERLMEEGRTGWWVPAARVRHMIPKARQSRAYLFEYYRRCGETQAFLRRRQRASGTNATPMMGPIALSARMAWHGSWALAALLTARHRKSLSHLAHLGYCVGILDHRRTSRAARRGNGHD